MLGFTWYTWKIIIAFANLSFWKYKSCAKAHVKKAYTRAFYLTSDNCVSVRARARALSVQCSTTKQTNQTKKKIIVYLLNVCFMCHNLACSAFGFVVWRRHCASRAFHLIFRIRNCLFGRFIARSSFCWFSFNCLFSSPFIFNRCMRSRSRSFANK